MQDLENYYAENAFDYIIQEFMQGDCDADAYIDYYSKEVVSIFSKKKIETRIGGASKTISFKDQRLFDFVQSFMHLFDFAGAIDMDFFFRDGEYYLSEINPRFGGAYLHAYGAGVDFFKLIINNINGVTNEVRIGDYDEGVLMLMYDDVVITKEVDLLEIIMINHVYIIAEAGVNHNGRLDLALQLCNAAKDAGADAVKFQTWKTEKIVTRNAELAVYQENNISDKTKSQFKMLKELELSYDNFEVVKNHCDEIGIQFLSTPDEIDSLDFLCNFNLPFIKLGSEMLPIFLFFVLLVADILMLSFLQECRISVM